MPTLFAGLEPGPKDRVMVTPVSQVGPALERREEAPLLRRLRAHDAEAFELIVRTHSGRLLAVARRLLKDEHAAQDAVQEAFLNAFRSIHTFRETSSLSTWLHRIVVNAALMHLRRTTRRPETSIEGLLPRFDTAGRRVEAVDECHVSAESALLGEEMRAAVHACIDKLPSSFRTLLLLRDIEEFSTVEAATLLGISPNAAKVRLHRARQALGTLLRGARSAECGPGWTPLPLGSWSGHNRH